MAHPLNDYVVINKHEVEMITKQLKRAIHYCREAQSVDYKDPHQEPTATYPGSSGYAGSCMTTVLDTLENAIDGASLFEEAN